MIKQASQFKIQFHSRISYWSLDSYDIRKKGWVR